MKRYSAFSDDATNNSLKEKGDHSGNETMADKSGDGVVMHWQDMVGASIAVLPPELA